MKKKIRIRGREINLRQCAPNLITSGNMLCGFLSIILTMKGLYVPAAWLIAFAVFFDFMDGKVARMLGVSSDFGVEFDSLGDVVSFGVAPALLVYAAFLQAIPGVFGALFAAFFALCGALRLARFNVVHLPGPFQGLPIPAGGLFLVSWIMAKVNVPLYVMLGIVICTGLLMISSFPYGNLKGLKKGYIDRKKMLFLKGLMVAVILFAREKAPLVLISLYIISGLLKFDWEKWLSLVEDKIEVDHE